MGRGRPNRAGARKRAARDRAREGRRVRHPRSQPHRVGALRLRARTCGSGRGSDLPVEHAGRVRVRPRARERGRLPRRPRPAREDRQGSSSRTSSSCERLDELRALGREHAGENPDAVERAREQIGDDDLFTLIYTSGTTGPPKGCMILNRNYYDMVGTVDEIEAFFVPTDVMLLYLPLAHNFGRLMHLLGAHLGFTIAFLVRPAADRGRHAAGSADDPPDGAACAREGAYGGVRQLRRHHGHQAAPRRLGARSRQGGERAVGSAANRSQAALL